MPYVLGIDIGCTTTAAAVARRWGAEWSTPEAVALRAGSATVPSTLHLSAGGAMTVGAPAVGGDGRTVRCFPHRIGDEVPVVVGGDAYPAQTLTAVLAGWVAEQARVAEGAPAEAVVVSHPAGWGTHRRELLHRALTELGLPRVTLLPAPVTIAEYHAARDFPGTLAAVYRLGGENFEAALVRRHHDGTYGTVGLARSLPGCGGADLTEELADHVRAVLARGPATTGRVGVDIPPHQLTMACDRAKHELTVATETDVVLDLPSGPTRVPVSRAQFEELVRPTVAMTVDLLIRAVHNAGLTPAELDGVLLAGGSARLPLVAELLGAAVPCPVQVGPDPELAVAVGAALAAGQVVAPRPRPAPGAGRGPTGTAPVAAASAVPVVPPPDHGIDLGEGPPPRPPVRITPLELPQPSRRALNGRRGRKGSTR
ncbi:Hsp70 family protein [Micromonospora sp. KC606]|uniref:Hsp70 family protein n=1 Tax=Micromonospora sp. KC606 TaxID=2530379 RepID=UPI0010492B04|nr:Hsp70 family protein [Micromonospora sp. KC606]TDC77279.1 Hsp70 family protein [Micromonospora sp. KC606]